LTEQPNTPGTPEPTGHPPGQAGWQAGRRQDLRAHQQRRQV